MYVYVFTNFEFPIIEGGVLQGPSAEEQLAEELQEAIAEAHCHQKMAAQQPDIHRRTRPYQPEVGHHPSHMRSISIFTLMRLFIYIYTYISAVLTVLTLRGTYHIAYQRHKQLRSYQAFPAGMYLESS